MPINRRKSNIRSILPKKQKFLSKDVNLPLKPDAIMESPILFESRARLSFNHDVPVSENQYPSTVRTVTLKRHKVPAIPSEELFVFGKDGKSAPCMNDPCGREVACSPRKDGFVCVCSNGVEISPGGICPYNEPVNFTPPAIHLPVPSPVQKSFSQVWIFGLLASFCLMGIVALIIIYWRRKRFLPLLRSRESKGVIHSENEDIHSKSNIVILGNIANNPNYCESTDISESLDNISAHLISESQIHLLGEVGEGCFGKVYKAEYGPKNYGLDSMQNSPCISSENNYMNTDNNSWDKTIVAVKVLKKFAGTAPLSDFFREAQIVAKFDHPNILILIGIVLSENFIPWMVFEYMTYGDLTDVLRSYNKEYESTAAPKRKINLTDLIDICTDIASGMKYLAKQRFVHRDLACRNCLVGENFSVKISDFGMCRDVYTCDYYKVDCQNMLPVRWMSPESIQYGKFTMESDIWAFGVVVWEVFSFAKQPYYGNNNDQAVNLILEGVLLSPPDRCPWHVLEVMKNCWRSTPGNRPKFKGVLQLLHKARHFAVQNEGRFPTDDLNYTTLVTGSIPVDADAYLLPTPTHEKEYLTLLNEISRVSMFDEC